MTLISIWSTIFVCCKNSSNMNVNFHSVSCGKQNYMNFKTHLSSSMRFDFINLRMDDLRKYFFATLRCLRGSNNMHRNGFELGYFWRLSDSSSSVLVALQFTCYFSLFTVPRNFRKINKTDRFAIKSLSAMFSLWKRFLHFSFILLFVKTAQAKQFARIYILEQWGI